MRQFADAAVSRAETPPARPRSARNRLEPPIQRTPLLERDLVLRSLDLARAGRLTQVIGPPGSGKTTVLAQWRARLLRAGVAVAWYAASERDREPQAFVHMLARALQHAGIDVRHTGLIDTPDAEPVAAMDSLLLALETAGREVVVIVDEYDRVESPRVAALVEALIETAGDGVHLVLAARRKPQLAVSVLRAQGAVRTVDAGELKLGRDELARMLGMSADAPELEVVAERTEGWPVAAELYRLWRARVGEGDRLSPLFSGQVSEVADYLTEQVFASLRPELQALVEELSLFGYIDPELADHVRDRTGSLVLLEEVEAALPGLVEHGVGETGPIFRFHPLLADYARGRAQRAGAWRDRHRRAAEWLSAHQHHAEAIGHAQLAGDPAFLDEVIGAVATLPVFLAQGAGELRLILRAVTPAQIAARPRLQLMSALAHFKLGFFLEAAAMLQAIREATDGFRRDPFGADHLLRVEGLALDLLFGAYIAGPEADMDAALAAFLDAAHADPLMWAMAQNILIVRHEERGDLKASRECIARTEAIYRTHGLLRFAEVSLLNHDLILALAHGQLRQGAELAGRLRRARPPQFGNDVPVLAMAAIGGAAIDYERRYAETAADAVRQGLDLFGEAETWSEPYAIAHEVIVDVALRRGGADGVTAVVEEARRKVRRIGVAPADSLLGALHALHLVRAGELAAAEPLIAAVMARRGAWRSGAPSAWRERDASLTALSRWSLAHGDGAAARQHAAELREEGRAGGRLRTLLKGMVLSAMAQGSDDAPAAALELREALALAQPDGFVAVFAEEGEAIAPLLAAAAADEPPGPVKRHAEAVARALTLGRRQVNALNEREAQIVAHLAQGASNKLIARRLGLTENTIKFHLKKVFAKLGVTSRKAAAAAARDLAG